MNIDASLESSLAALGYSAAWLQDGFLSIDTLKKQIARYQADPDPHPEHYRYDAFRTILSSRSQRTDADIQQYIALAQTDSDFTMARAALLDLLTWSGLTTEQFERLVHHPLFAEPLFQKAGLRRRLLTELASSPLVSATLFANCIACSDPVIQRALVSQDKLSQEQLQTLAEQGVTRAVRNLAFVKLSK